jgi:hypothetical protein
MKTITVSKRAKVINELLDRARRQNLTIRSSDGHEFILAEVDDFDREIALTRRNKRLMKLLDRRARRKGTVPLVEAKARLGLHGGARMTRTIGLTCVVLALLAQPFAISIALADERLEGIACRSVHLQWQAPEGVAFYNEITPAKSADGTYFCVCGFNMGYYGIQELASGKKLLIFSVWDPGRQNDKIAVAEDKRVRMLYKDEAVRTGRFGGEGTGGQSFFDYDWKIGETYRFLVTAKVEGERTAFAAWFFVPEKKEWKHLVTFSTLTAGKRLSGYYSFIEDFRRNRVSATKVREARFGNGWIKTKDDKWVALTRARFTADRNPVTNINAGIAGERFLLVTGGDTQNTSTPLGQSMERPAGGASTPPELPSSALEETKN